MNFLDFVFAVLIRICVSIIRNTKHMDGWRTVMIDFDGVLLPTGELLYSEDFVTTRPPKTIKDFVSWLYENNFRVGIFTTRIIFHPTHYFKIKRYLKKNKIKFEFITAIKFPAIMYIDDCAFAFDANGSYSSNNISLQFLTEITEEAYKDKITRSSKQRRFQYGERRRKV